MLYGNAVVSGQRPALPACVTTAGVTMPFWQRLLATLAAMIVVSLVIGLIFEALFGFPLPSYAAGLVGGLTALPVWEFLRRIGPRSGAPR